MPGVKKVWWYRYGQAFTGQMEGFVNRKTGAEDTNATRGRNSSQRGFSREEETITTSFRYPHAAGSILSDFGIAILQSSRVLYANLVHCCAGQG